MDYCFEAIKWFEALELKLHHLQAMVGVSIGLLTFFAAGEQIKHYVLSSCDLIEKTKKRKQVDILIFNKPIMIHKISALILLFSSIFSLVYNRFILKTTKFGGNLLLY